ncbi:uncharacterized protein B0P05DRAFT_477604 [Gilbertella persicaria]|uniref:uncharacterized protein n=1 Tax=Gilbertella persicaria TaxID=101096 RepID=UPI00221FF58A|nr:uncharacterized protein B0P05DRAFT_477604 [Gilbertella persicaria]KAI8061466.1 hypothetical protein B0P05DRAFT_477604 [Gilbertella persicaria]
MIELRLEQYARDKFTFQQQSNQLDHADYYLMGVLMVRYDSTANKGYSSNAWSLYLRDYIEDPEGSIWRIFCDEQDQKVSSDQALADIRGMTTHHTEPTQFSKDYRPVYVFYANLDLLQNQQTQPEGHVITLEDYTFDEEDEDSRIQEEEEEEDVPCMHCGIKEIVNDINDMFFCELCNQGVHQLCEEPPIQAFEKNVDPWYCRTCCRAQGLPIPTEQEFSSAKRKRQDEPSSTEQEKVIKKTE